MAIFGILGLQHGDAHVIRNAGGVITDDVIRSLCVSQRALGTREILLLHHTNCGLQNVSDDAFKASLEHETGHQAVVVTRIVRRSLHRRGAVDAAARAVAVHRSQGPHPRVRVRGRDRAAPRSESWRLTMTSWRLSKRPNCSTFPRAASRDGSRRPPSGRSRPRRGRPGSRERNPVVDAGFLIYERDRVSAGSVLGSAIAFRLFLFFVPFVLFCVGLIGLVSGEFDADSISSAGSLRGQLAEQVRAAQDQSRTAQLIAAGDRPVPDGDHREVARQGARRVQQPRLVGARQRRRQGACARRDRRCHQQPDARVVGDQPGA